MPLPAVDNKQIKLVYYNADGELRRSGKNYKLSHYLITYQNNIIKIHGYVIRGSRTIIEHKVNIVIEDSNKNNTLLEEVERTIL